MNGRIGRNVTLAMSVIIEGILEKKARSAVQYRFDVCVINGVDAVCGFLTLFNNAATPGVANSEILSL
jgi:hypothetical protein